MWGNMMGWGGYGGGGSLLGMGSMLLWWVLIIVAIVVLVRWLSSGSLGTWHESSRDRSLTILRERYARGEIDKSEFDARRRDLA
ncbi:MAG TPA: SHOCT domain-containing protein [Burkholderiales bacterium]|nr:SHOCT domain-containing protein [Burkholderiales bacterium]